MTDIIRRIMIMNEPVLYVDGRRVLDERGLRLLSILDSVNSLLEASRSLGIPYSRVWDYIAKLERSLKEDIISVRRGGRGRSLELTPTGLRIVRYVKNNIREGPRPLPRIIDIDIHIAGSDDMLLGSVVGFLKQEQGVNILYSRIGSLRGLFSLLMGDSHIAPVHLLDPDSNEYNVPHVRRLGLEGVAYLLFGYYREVGFICRRGLLVESIDDIIRNNYRIVNRCKGSGMRIFLDKLVREYASASGMSFSEIVNTIRGYGDEVATHREAVAKIVEGQADVMLGLRVDAVSAGLDFKPLRWESFDFVVSRHLVESEKWGIFFELFKELTPKLIDSMDGYKLSENFGRMIEV